MSKIKIEANGMDQHVYLDDKEISSDLSAVTLILRVNELPKVELTLAAPYIESVFGGVDYSVQLLANMDVKYYDAIIQEAQRLKEKCIKGSQCYLSEEVEEVMRRG